MNCGAGSGLNVAVQSVEVSCFVHATEDREVIADSLSRTVTGEVQPEEEKLEGHFGNPIFHVRYHLKGEEGVVAMGRIAYLLSRETKDKIMRELGHLIDEHNALYLRFSKQSLVAGKLEMGTEDPVRVRVKPRGFVPRGEIMGLYKILLDSSK